MAPSRSRRGFAFEQSTTNFAAASALPTAASPERSMEFVRASRQIARSRSGFALIDAVIAGVILAIGLSAILSIAGRALTMEQKGEIEIRAASALDELLSSVVTEGVETFSEIQPTSGRFEANSPYSDFEFDILIEAGDVGVPARVVATVLHETGKKYSIETHIALKRGAEPDPVRYPTSPIDREARYEEERAKLEAD
ncbi:MAG: hypothetical protein EXS10_00235 [Phycisphaerales bacterium]|nr:hypothetical protein [Phycisphaerales bacterium]